MCAQKKFKIVVRVWGINTVILTENQSNETSEGSGKLAAPPSQGRSWSIPRSRDLPEMSQSGLSNKTARFTRHHEKRDRTGGLPWREYIGSIPKDTDTVSDSWKAHQSNTQRYEVTQARIWISRRFLTKRLRKDTHHCCTILDSQDMKIQ